MTCLKLEEEVLISFFTSKIKALWTFTSRNDVRMLLFPSPQMMTLHNVHRLSPEEPVSQRRLRLCRRSEADLECAAWPGGSQ